LPGRTPSAILSRMSAERCAVRVLLVDDSVAVRERIASLLSTVPGVEVAGQAGDASSAKALLQAGRPDILVLDIDLPGESGIELLRTVKSDAAGPVVIMFTSYAHSQFRRACAEAGADYFFDKSAESDQLVDTLQRLAAGVERKEG